MGSFIFGVITGVIVIFIIFALIGKFSKKNKPFVEKGARGLYEHSYEHSRVDMYGKKEITQIDALFEVQEIESTDTMSKVKVLSAKTTNSDHNKPGSASNQRLISMVEDTWIETKDIKWITSAAEIRNDKIDKILS